MPLTMSIPVARLLKEGTACAHREAEEILAPKLAGINSYDDYAAILQMFYGFFHPLERILAQHISTELIPDIDQRRSSVFIIMDLKSIGCSTKELRVCERLPKISSSLAALGAMYVLEGSTLGGRKSGRMLMKNSAVQFEADGKKYHPRNSFKQWQQTVRQTAMPWTSEEIEVAESFKNFVVEYTLNKIYS
jgi:heme oxygenase (biliverdin-IX-beta and delta-forming)